MKVVKKREFQATKWGCNLRNLYKIISVTDKNGEVDQERIDAIKDICDSMTGEIPYPDYVSPGNCFCLLWDNDSGRMMRTSSIESVESNDKRMKVITRNTIYILEVVE